MLNNGYHGKTSQSVRDASGRKHAAQCQDARRSPHGTADDCHAASCRHYERTRSGAGVAQPERSGPKDVAGGRNSAGPPPTGLPPFRGDTVYGAAAIATFLFDGDNGKKARRRVYNLWAFYRDRHERAGFFKLKGGLCLSISKWQAFLDRD